MFGTTNAGLNPGSCVRPGELRGETIIDRENWVEQLFTGIGAMGFVIGFISFIALLFNAFSNTKFLDEIGFAPLPVFLLSGALLAIGAALRSQVDYYLVVDRESGTFQHYHHYFEKEWRTQICDFSEVYGVAVDGKRVTRSEKQGQKTKRYYEWIYGLVLVLHNGKTVRLIDRESNDFQQILALGEQLAGEFDTGVYGEAKRVLEIVKTGDPAAPIQLVFPERSSAEKLAVKVIQLLLLGLLVSILYALYG